LCKPAIDALHHDIDDAVDLFESLFFASPRNLIGHRDIGNRARMSSTQFKEIAG